MECQYCKGKVQKAGKQKNGAQKLYCKSCKKYQQSAYQYKACQGFINSMIKHLVCEGVGIRRIARVLQIGVNTGMRRIISIANRIAKPFIPQNQPVFEVDELWTYIGHKANEYWLAYALNKSTRQIVDFVIGKRTKTTLKNLIDNLLVSGVNQIRTDKLTIYQRLIPANLHRYGNYCINHIERRNLSIRTHLKRLSRRTICFSRNVRMLESCLRIYFWSGRDWGAEKRMPTSICYMGERQINVGIINKGPI